MMRWWRGIGRTLLCVFILGLINFDAFAQSLSLKEAQDIFNEVFWSRIKATYYKTNDEDLLSHEAFAQFVNRQGLSERHRAALIYYGVATRIRYYVYKKNNKDKFQDDFLDKPDYTWRNRLGICGDYVRLYRTIAEDCKIPVIEVDGYDRQSEEDTVCWQSARHAWLLVRLNNVWHPVDPTWGAGYCADGVFYERFDPEWFAPQPDIFITTHIPTSPIFQLLKCPVTVREIQDHKSLDYADLRTEAGSPCISFTDSIDKYLATLDEYKDVYVARQGFYYNPLNTESLGYAFYKRGLFLYIYHLKNHELDPNLLAIFYRELDYILYLFRSSRDYFSRSQSKDSTEAIQVIDERINRCIEIQKLLRHHRKDAKWWELWLINNTEVSISLSSYLQSEEE